MHGSTPNIIYVRTMSADVPRPPVGSIGPWGQRRGVKNSKNWGWSHSCCGQLPFLFFSAMPNVVQYVGHRGVHIPVSNRLDRPRRFYRVGQKVRKNFEFFTISRIYVHISQKLLKIEACKQRMEKKLYLSPIQLSHVFGRIGHGVLQGEPKSE